MDTYSFDAVVAAKDAAYYAAWSAAAAWMIGLASLTLTAGGLVFVWRQLKSTEAAARAATVAAEAAAVTSRPWLTLSIERVIFGLNDHSDVTAVNCQVDFVIKNIGQMPAMQCGIAYDVFIQQRHDISEDMKSHLLNIGPHNPSALFPGEIIRQGIVQAKYIPMSEEREYFSVTLGVSVFYKLHAEGEWKYTMQFGSLQPFEPRDHTKNYGIYRGMPHQQAHFSRLASTPDPI